ncbi:hypothetical protein DPMN_093669 [Dreissena polymorpha]|uniref:Uncharacterized protein n=1 Tax=Dreissena polymorpha TaxID=45954 RepID=A0A9D4R177_DREPO|nr:hypothetical protein DPMN_093669 [Dreissena polymorpha]
MTGELLTKVYSDECGYFSVFKCAALFFELNTKHWVVGRSSAAHENKVIMRGLLWDLSILSYDGWCKTLAKCKLDPPFRLFVHHAAI